MKLLAAVLGTVLIATAAPAHSDAVPPTEQVSTGKVKSGLEVLLQNPPPLLIGKHVGLITNPTGVDRLLRSSVDLLAARSDIHLVALFGPEHGVRGDALGSFADGTDPKTHLPVYSLCCRTHSPSPASLKGLDALIFDIQDTGARFYTYTSTLALSMQAAASRGILFVVLDRPNPLGGVEVAGPVLDPRWKSFIGMYPIPILHGMTVGELARLFNREFGINANLMVIPMDGWKRSMWFDDTGLPWVITSPGIPHFQTAVLYPAMGPLGDTNLSVGVQTTKPFEFVGATYAEPWQLRSKLEARRLNGVAFREAYWRGAPWLETGGPQFAGVEIRVTDRAAYHPVDLTLQILDVVRHLYPNRFQWGPQAGGGYLFDLDMGTDKVRHELSLGKSPQQIEHEWQADLDHFMKIRASYLLYP